MKQNDLIRNLVYQSSSFKPSSPFKYLFKLMAKSLKNSNCVLISFFPSIISLPSAFKILFENPLSYHPSERDSSSVKVFKLIGALFKRKSRKFFRKFLLYKQEIRYIKV